MTDIKISKGLVLTVYGTLDKATEIKRIYDDLIDFNFNEYLKKDTADKELQNQLQESFNECTIGYFKMMLHYQRILDCVFRTDDGWYVDIDFLEHTGDSEMALEFIKYLVMEFTRILFRLNKNQYIENLEQYVERERKKLQGK